MQACLYLIQTVSRTNCQHQFAVLPLTRHVGINTTPSAAVTIGTGTVICSCGHHVQKFHGLLLRQKYINHLQAHRVIRPLLCLIIVRVPVSPFWDSNRKGFGFFYPPGATACSTGICDNLSSPTAIRTGTLSSKNPCWALTLPTPPQLRHAQGMSLLCAAARTGLADRCN